MKSYKTIPPGFCLIHSSIKKIMTGQSAADLKFSNNEVIVIKKKLDDYLMYIWALMGDIWVQCGIQKLTFEHGDMHKERLKLALNNEQDNENEG